nr:MAG TPA: tail repeat-like protein [Caudoviricetes sp.]
MELQVNLKEWLKKLVYMKTEVDTKLSSKANTNHTHDIASLPDETDMLGHMENDFYTALDTKANKTTATTSANGLMSKEDKSKLDDIATEANKTIVDSSLSSSSTNPVQNKVVNSALNGKANSSHSHSISNITNLQSALDSKSATGHNHDERYYTETEMNTKLNGKANSSHSHSINNITNLQSALDSKSGTGHNHDDRYYTETEIDTKLESKSDINHNHDNKYSLLTHHHTGLDGISDIICDSAGQQSVAGYRKVFRLKITKQYFDSPVSFEFVQRKCRQTGRVHIVFNSSTSTDPSLRSFTYEGAIEMPIYLYKESAGTWVFIIKEVSSYDTVNVRFLPLSSSIKNSCTITPINEYLANLPSTNIQVGISDLTVSTHTLANGAKLYKYGKIVLAVFNNYQYSGKTPNVWTDIFNIPSAYKPISTDNIYGHSPSGMILAGSNKISMYPPQSSGGLFGSIVWVTS